MSRKPRPQTEAYISDQEVCAKINNIEQSQAYLGSPGTRTLQQKRRGINLKSGVLAAGLTHNIGEFPSQAIIPNITKELQTPIPVHNESPWRHYQGVVTALDFGTAVVIASKKSAPMTRLFVRKFAGQNAKDVLSHLQTIRHANIVAAIEAFAEAELLHIVFEEMHMPLTCILKSPVDPDGRQIATIIGQVVDALAFLEQHKLSHGALDCSNVLVHNAGDIKLAIHEPYTPLSSKSQSKDMSSLCSMTMKLMQGYVLDQDKIGVENPSRWMDSGLIEFLPAAKSTDSMVKLRQYMGDSVKMAYRSALRPGPVCSIRGAPSLSIYAHTLSQKSVGASSGTQHSMLLSTID